MVPTARNQCPGLVVASRNVFDGFTITKLDVSRYTVKRSQAYYVGGVVINNSHTRIISPPLWAYFCTSKRWNQNQRCNKKSFHGQYPLLNLFGILSCRLL